MDKKKAEKELFKKAQERLDKAANKAGRPVKILSRRKMLPYSPGGWKICIDAEVKAARGR